MLGLKTLGLVLLAGLAGGAVLSHKLTKIKTSHKPKKNRVIEVELSEGVEPEDIIITVPRRPKN